MSKNLDHVEVYKQGVVRAVQAGHIVFSSEFTGPYGPHDSFSHFEKGFGANLSSGKPDSMNTRPLSPIVRDMLTIQARVKEVYMLEAGFGMGQAAYEAWQHGCTTPHKITVDGLGLTPVDPMLSIGDAEKLLSNKPLDGEVSVLPEPFMRRQYIGAFPDDFQGSYQPAKLPRRTYSLIHDNRGPYSHNTYGSGSIAGNAYRDLMTDDAILMVADASTTLNFVGVRYEEGDLRFLVPKRKGTQESSYAIFARRKSILAKTARKIRTPQELCEDIISGEWCEKIISAALESPRS